MHIALLHLLAAQAPPGTVVTTESVALGVLVAVVGVAVAYGLLRSQVSDVRERLTKVEAVASPLQLSLARLEVRLDNIDRSVEGGFDGLRRELHASGALPRAPRGDG